MKWRYGFKAAREFMAMHVRLFICLSLCLDSGLCSDQNFLNLTVAAAGLKSRLDIITYLLIVVIFTNPYIENWMQLLKNQKLQF